MQHVTFKGHKTQIGDKLLHVGDDAPSFTLVDKDLKNKTLEDFKGKHIVLWVVPSLDTSLCLLSTKHLNEMAKKHHDSVFLVISADLPFAQARICGAEKLTNITTLSMMRSKHFGLDYGVLIKEGAVEGLLSRSVFVISPHKKISYIEIVSEVTQEPNYTHLESALK